MQILPGTFHPLGACCDAGGGVNFALFSEHASAVELCLFDAADRETRIDVPRRSLFVWHAYVPGIGPGQRYGWRVHGPFAPQAGHRFDPTRVLVDPYARAVSEGLRSVVVDERFDWGDDRARRSVPWSDTIVYELHVKGFTKLHPGVPERLRGTFLGLASDAAIDHLRSLGVTTVDLLPVQQHVDEPRVAARGMTNYWGYSTLAFFAPDRRFATPGGDPVREFKTMVRRLHAAGIEVVLDVVYNHTCEGDRDGPTLSYRGIDNSVYYRLDPRDRSRYLDFSGCGNTLDASHPQVLKLVTDSLRYWVTEMHVDGFRFDLAAALARGVEGDVERVSAFFSVVHQDPVLSRIKLIAEPWDVGHGGYQVGNFPVLWTEWNGRFRDTVRRFWRGEKNVVADLGYRLTGSSDLFADDGRHPHASINLVTAHDGFTLRDLVSYDKKHNEANGEDNRDGWDDNASQNCGVEGETDDPRIVARRLAVARSLMTTLLLSQGVPMIEMGDEKWHTQRGNNNPYCHDSELTWVEWSAGVAALGRADDTEAHAMLELVRALVRLRERHGTFRRSAFLRGEDIAWLRPDGAPMTGDDWQAPERAAIAFRLEGKPVDDDSFFVAMNAEGEPMKFALPAGPWKLAIDTGDVPARVEGSTVTAGAKSVVVFVQSLKA